MKIKWKTALKNVSFVILMLNMCLIFGQKKVILIDPGHGGKDSGAIGVNGILEKTVVLNLAIAIIELNSSLLEDEFDIYLTRYKDTLISLSDRSQLAKHLNANLFVSLHCNASKTPSKGMEVYIHNSEYKNTKKSTVLGISILHESTQKLGFKTRGIKFANFQVLRDAAFSFPAVLVEMGFITDIDEAYYFLKPKNTQAIALAILMGITNYLNTGL